jgi:hypothetical protein
MPPFPGGPMETRTVYWRGKFNGEAVTINASTFDPALHSDVPWEDAPAPVPLVTTSPPAKRGKK